MLLKLRRHRALQRVCQWIARTGQAAKCYARWRGKSALCRGSLRAQRQALFFNSSCNHLPRLSATHHDLAGTSLTIPFAWWSTTQLLLSPMATIELSSHPRPAIGEHPAREVIDVDSFDEEEIQLLEQPRQPLYTAGLRSHSRRATRGPSGSSSASAILVPSDDEDASRLRPGHGMD